MTDEIIRPQDIDQVLFLGENTLQLVEFRLKFPSAGSPDYSTIIYGEPYFIGGMFKHEKTALAIDNNRILNNTVYLGGRRTLIVLADLGAVDKNRSILDTAIADYLNRIDSLNMKNKHLEADSLLIHQFIKENNIEDSLEEWTLNKLELLRVAQTKTQKPESGTAVSLEVGGDQKKGKD